MKSIKKEDINSNFEKRNKSNNMVKIEERFKMVYKQGNLNGMENLVDKEIGVNYVFSFSGYAGGLTVLLDGNGKSVIIKE